jgi:hypothetical protein
VTLMAETPKDTPEPLEEPEALRFALERAAEGKPDRRFAISLRVAGGAPSQRYRFEFAARGTGTASSTLSSEAPDQQGKSDERLDPAELADLAREVLASGVLDTPAEQPRFLPDTLVGILDITNGTTTLRRYFAADPDQAQVQAAAPPAGVTKAADAIFSLGAKRMGKRSVKP